MGIESAYEKQQTAIALDYLSKGHEKAENLRELLIFTTLTFTAPLIDAYLKNHLNDERLLKMLIDIALEGEDAGDAPWAAANYLKEFPGSMLNKHEKELRELSNHPWAYLSEPSRDALSKKSD